ncbi:MAG: helix-turn-helix transcriptional regulator [Phaeodactylibacter sp.]|nr:helix-turn-helix transcriptional regulator [Phaeodactylibacter sp.]MCB9299247.1 helix-turn-helix transcriptional regulator [Lewinellaceae bacterium]
MVTTSKAGVQRMSDQLRHQELNFDNVIIHSHFRHFEKSVQDSGLSIKLGHRGAEHYFFDGQKHTVRPGRYLVVNRHRAFDCFLKSEEPIEAFCIYLSKQIVRDVVSALLSTPAQCLDNPIYLRQPEPVFQEKVYRTEENVLGHFLAQLRPILASGTPMDFEALYYTLAEKLIRSQIQIEQQIQRISSTRRDTREELYRRLSIARHYIMDNFRQEISLDELAREAALSKFHLLRTYKEAFGTTPYRQVLDLRLQRAQRLLAKGWLMEEIAFDLGFSDRRSFTKAFKKAFGLAPSGFRENRSTGNNFSSKQQFQNEL